MKVYTPLALLRGYRKSKRLARLFQDILKVSDAGLQEYLDEIYHRQKGHTNLKDVRDIYHSLEENLIEEELPKLR